jgi:uncharacterized lipoprotein YehR (DUF1307 family)
MKMTNAMLRISIVFFAVFLIASCSQKKTTENTLNLQCFETGNGWGYTIEHKGKQIIYQPNIPAIGNKTVFPTKQSAEKTGKLVLEKLIRGESPALSVDELKKAGIVKIGKNQQIIVI